MESHKTYQAINPVELAKISQELIVKNKTAYKHLATGLPVQQILDEIIPQLIKLYKGHVVQIVQFETDLSCINLAVLFDDSYTKEMHQAKMGKIHKAINSINDKYGPDTLTVINCNYRDVQDSNKNSSSSCLLRSLKQRYDLIVFHLRVVLLVLCFERKFPSYTIYRKKSQMVTKKLKFLYKIRKVHHLRAIFLMQWTTIYIDDSTNECYFCTFFRNAKYFMANFRNVIIYITTNTTTTGSQPRSLWSVADI